MTDSLNNGNVGDCSHRPVGDTLGPQPRGRSIMEQHQAESSQQRARFQYEAFFRRWAPMDPRDNHQFHVDLTMLLRQVSFDAQEPLLKQLTQIAMAQPMFHVPPNVVVKD